MLSACDSMHSSIHSQPQGSEFRVGDSDSLLAGVRYESTQIQRQLQFDKRIDSKEVQAGQLDARLVMWGNLDPTPPDDLPMSMAELQLELRQIIQQRLQYLRAE